MQHSNLTLETLLTEITTLRQELTDQRQKVAELEAKLTNPAPTQQPTLNPTRRRAITRFSALLLGGVAAATLVAPSALEAKIIVNPPGQSSRIGAIIQPPGAAAPTNSPTSTQKIALVASPDPSLDLSQVNGTAPVGVYGYAPTGVGVIGDGPTGIGVYGTSTNGTGVAGSSPSGTGVSGNSTSATGVSGSSDSYFGVYGNSTSGTGVYGISTNYIGVYAFSSTGAPLRIQPGNPPTYGGTGSPTKGDLYVDINGNLQIYNGTAWKQVAYL